VTQSQFTGEEFLAVQIGFLDIHDERDVNMLTRMVAYVKQHNLDKPFPLVYAQENEPNKASNFLVGLSSYMGTSIWSHLGQAYIETLILLGKTDPELLSDASTYLQAYRTNIATYGGYPELYNTNGQIFTAPFYKSVLHAGWVIDYEQAQMLYDDVTTTSVGLKK
jgi:hypothetical protein